MNRFVLKRLFVITITMIVMGALLFTGCTYGVLPKQNEGNTETPALPKDPAVPDAPEGTERPNTPSEPIMPEKPSDVVEVVYIYCNGNRVRMNVTQNSAVESLVNILRTKDIIYTASDYGGFEKVGSLGQSLPTENTLITAAPGDVVLYLGNQIVIFYGSNSWSYTKLGKIEGYSASALKKLLAGSSVQIKISLK